MSESDNGIALLRELVGKRVTLRTNDLGDVARMTGTLLEGNHVLPDWVGRRHEGDSFSLVRDEPDPNSDYPNGVLLSFEPRMVTSVEWIEGWENRALIMRSHSSIRVFSLEGEEPPVPTEVEAAHRHTEAQEAGAVPVTSGAPFGDELRGVMFAALNEAGHVLGDESIGPQHLLFGAIEVAAGVESLPVLGIDPARLHEDIAALERLEGPGGGNVPLSPDSYRVFETAMREAFSDGRRVVAVRDMLLALLDDPTAGALLARQGVQPDVLREKLRQTG